MVNERLTIRNARKTRDGTKLNNVIDEMHMRISVAIAINLVIIGIIRNLLMQMKMCDRSLYLSIYNTIKFRLIKSECNLITHGRGMYKIM